MIEKHQTDNCLVGYSTLVGERILGSSSTVFMNPVLQNGH